MLILSVHRVSPAFFWFPGLGARTVHGVFGGQTKAMRLPSIVGGRYGESEVGARLLNASLRR